jgi:hypothetical protein
MELTPRNYITKASLGGRKFLYNPNALNDSISVTYNDLKTAGISYPIMTYGGGERRPITFDIYLNDKVEEGITESFIAHLHSFVPPARKKGYRFKAPRTIRFAFGWFVKDCYLTNMDISYTAFSPDLRPIEATVTVTLAIIQ